MTDATLRQLDEYLAATPHRKTDTLNNRAWELRISDLHLAAECATQAYDTARKAGYDRGIAYALRTMGFVEMIRSSNYPATIRQLQAALEMMEEAGDRRGEAAVLNLLGAVHRRTGETREALELHRQGLKASREAKDYGEEAAALNGIGFAERLAGELPKAFAAHRQALDISRRHGDHAEEAAALVELGNDHLHVGELDEALRCYTEALDLATRIGHMLLAAYASGNIGVLHERRGEHQQALHYETRSRQLKEETGDRWGLGVTLNNIAIIRRSLGDYAGALEANLQSLGITEEIGDQEGETVALYNVGQIYELLGDRANVLAYYLRSLRLAEKLGHRRNEAYLLARLGQFHESQGDYTKALLYYFKSFNLHQAGADPRGMCDSMLNIGHIYLYLENTERALEYFNRCLQTAGMSDDGAEGVAIHIGLGTAYRARREFPEAMEHHLHALEIAERSGIQDLVCQALQELADTYGEAGYPERSTEFRQLHLELTRKIFTPEIKSRLREMITGFEGRALHREMEGLQLRPEDRAAMNEALPKASRLRTERLLNPEAGLKERGAAAGVPGNMREIRVRTFGAFSVTIDGRELRKSDWKRKRARDLFKILLMNYQRGVTIDELMEQLWRGVADKNVELLVMNAISHIRRTLDPSHEPHRKSALLGSNGRSYVLNLGEYAWIDFLRFKQLVAEARRSKSPQRKRELFEEAAALFTGEFMKEDLYENWTELERDRLHDMLAEALFYLGSDYLREGRIDEAIAVARRIIEQDSTSEQGYEILLGALVRDERFAEARKAFRTCTDAFMSELEMAPPEKLRRLAGSSSPASGTS